VNNLLTLTPAEFCKATDACKEGRDWAITQPTMADVWDNCPRGDWLMWVALRVTPAADDRMLRLFAVWCARSTPIAGGRVTGDLLTDPRSLAALAVAERYANEQATVDELVIAALAAHDAYADAHYDFAAHAAYAVCAAHAAYGYSPAAYAARAAADAAADAAAYDAYTDARLAQANQFRLMVSNPFPRKEAQS